MSEPVTTFDHEYSDPAAVAVGWEENLTVRESAQLTVRTVGRPHATPVVAAWAEDAIWFSTGTVEQRFANLCANSNVVLITGCNGWESGIDVVVEGEAKQGTDDGILTRVAPAFAGK
jgi:hypothetical protein